jgi:hypothetical protein
MMNSTIVKSNINSNSIFDFIDPSERSKLDEYLPYIKCFKCSEITFDQKQCTVCNINLCPKCKVCQHNLTQSRHLKTILDNLRFKCKNSSGGCREKDLKIHDLKTHLQKCTFLNSTSPHKARAHSSLITSSHLTNSSLFSSTSSVLSIHNKNKSFFEDSEFYPSSSSIVSDISNYEGKLSVKCPLCSTSFLNKKEFIDHSKTDCQKNKNQLQPLTSLKEVQQKFISYYLDNVCCKVQYAKENYQKFVENLNAKKEKISSIEKEISKISTPEIFLKDDLEYQNLQKTENELYHHYKDLEERALSQLRKINESKRKEDEMLMSAMNEYKNQLLILEIQEKWYKEELGTTYFPVDHKDECAICKNSDPKENKYLCQTCRQLYCVNKCGKKCFNQSCNKFICPMDTKDCKLCHKQIYCDTCKKKCFYQQCSNLFCPDCYKKNEHQARSNNVNCKFFTCEKDQICDCLMTSLYCAKCEKRLCNKCLVKDTAHFNFHENIK